jgi:hypothetical protein
MIASRVQAYAVGREPIWQHPVFADLFFDSLRDPTKPRPVDASSFTPALEILMTVYQNIINTNNAWLTGLSREEMTMFTLLMPSMLAILPVELRSESCRCSRSHC